MGEGWRGHSAPAWVKGGGGTKHLHGWRVEGALSTCMSESWQGDSAPARVEGGGGTQHRPAWVEGGVLNHLLHW